MSGKPKPTALRLIEGNPGKRPINKNEPKPKVEIPQCPDFLFPEAKKEWARIVPQLERLKLISLVDMGALVGYCQAFAIVEMASREIKLYGLTYTSEKGNTIQNPQVGTMNSALMTMHRFLSEFGMTPSSRSKISIGNKDTKKPKSQMESLLEDAV